MSSVYVVMVTFNGRKWLEKSINSLKNSSVKLKILIIDNGSTDGSQYFIKENFKEIELIESKINLGFGKANNIGLQRAYKKKYDYVFLLNQDAWIEPNTIKRLIQIHCENIEYGVLAPMQYNGSGELIDRLFMDYSVKPCRKLINDLLVDKNLVKEVYEVPFINGACWLIPYSTINKIGGFDPLFPHYGEDNDYINRIIFHGLKAGLCPKEKVYHDREHRNKTQDIRKMINERYIKLLADLKDVNAKHISVLFYVKLLLFSLLRMSFGKNKKYNKAQFYALLMILNNYNKVRMHRFENQQEYPHYIKLN